MKPRFDLIESRFIRPEDEAFALDIAVYKNILEADDYFNGVLDSFNYPCSGLIFHPRDKVNCRFRLIVNKARNK